VWPVTGGLERASAIFFAMGHNRFPREAMCAVFEASAVVWHLPNSERTLWFEVYQRSIHLASEFRANPKRTRQNIRAIRRAPWGRLSRHSRKPVNGRFEEADRYQLKLSPKDLRIFNPRWD
jgi:hypothetical protein